MPLEPAGGVLDREAQIGLGMFMKKTRVEWDASDLPIYVGSVERHGAGDEESSWAIKKITWSSGLPILIEGPLTGAWDDRATLNWL